MKPYDIYFHVSPEASITKFQGRYSQKYKTKGLFISPTFEAIACSWAPYVSTKKHPRSSKSFFYNKDYYQNLTVYKLEVPKTIVEICKEQNNQKYQEARAKVKNDTSLLGAWGWDLELFVPSEYLNSIKIIGKKTYKYYEFGKMDCAKFERDNCYSNDKYAEAALPNIAAKKYLEIQNLLSDISLKLIREESNFIRSNFDAKQLNKLNNFFVKTVNCNYFYTPDSKRSFSSEEYRQINLIYENSLDQINRLKSFARSFFPKEMLLNHKFDFRNNKIKNCYCDYTYLKPVKDCDGNNCLRCSSCRKIAYVKT